MTACRWSVLLFVRNDDLYLDRVLESVLEKAPNDTEILAVDAGSTDGSSLALSEWAAVDRRLRVVPLLAVSEADGLNTALKLARGRHVGFLTARAIFHSDSWQRLADAAGEEAVVVGLPSRRPGPCSVQEALAAAPTAWDLWVPARLIRDEQLSFSSPIISGDVSFALSACVTAARLCSVAPLSSGTPRRGSIARAELEVLAARWPQLARNLTQLSTRPLLLRP